MKSTYLAVLTIGSVLAGGFAFAGSQYDSGVSDTEIKIGNTMPYSGPASAWGMVGKSEAAYFAMINDQGGVNGRKINFISRDDGYSPPTNEKSAMHWKALEMIGQGCLLSLATTNFFRCCPHNLCWDCRASVNGSNRLATVDFVTFGSRESRSW
jgi:hypothetical protein